MPLRPEPKITMKPPKDPEWGLETCSRKAKRGYTEKILCYIEYDDPEYRRSSREDGEEEDNGTYKIISKDIEYDNRIDLKTIMSMIPEGVPIEDVYINIGQDNEEGGSFDFRLIQETKINMKAAKAQYEKDIKVYNEALKAWSAEHKVWEKEKEAFDKQQKIQSLEEEISKLRGG